MRKLNIDKQKIKENIKNNKLLLIVFLVIWVAVAGITLDKYSSSLGMKSFGNYYDATEVLEVDKDTTLIETAELEHEANSISIEFATFARNNNGNIFIKVEGINTRKVYLDTSIKAEDALDNAFMSFNLNETVDNTKDPSVVITITSDSENATCVGVYYSQKAFENSSFTNNNQIIDGDLKVRFQREHEILGKFNKQILTLLLISFTIAIIVLVFTDKAEKIFTTLTIIFGIVFMIVITPMSPPDEQKHYEYSYQLSNFIMGKGDEYLKIEHEYQDYTDCAGHMNVSSFYERLEEDIFDSYEHNKHYEDIDENNDIKEATYYLCYIPQAIAITITRLLSCNFFGVFYSGRLFNLLFYAACVYFAIKKTPMHKTLFGIIATMPIFIQQAASYSYDSCLNGLMLVIAAFFFDWMNKKEIISNKEIIELLLVILFVTPLKRIYSLFVFCFIFVPFEKFGSKKRKLIALLIEFVPLMIFLINFFTPYVTKLFRNISDNINTSYQIDNSYNVLSGDSQDGVEQIAVYYANEEKLYHISTVIKLLPETINLYFTTIRRCIKNWYYEALGKTLSGVSLSMPLSLAHFMSYIVLAATLLKEEIITPIKVRVSFILICIIIGLFVMTGMLLTWTEVGSEIIQGMQGRYFSPLLFFAMTVINNPKIYLTKNTNKYIIFAQIIMMFETIIYVLSYTFVN